MSRVYATSTYWAGGYTMSSSPRRLGLSGYTLSRLPPLCLGDSGADAAPLRISIVNSFYPPWRGGAETYAFNLSKAFSARGHEVTILCASEPLTPGPSQRDSIVVRRHRLLARVYGTPIMPSLVEDLLSIDTDIFHANFPSPYIAFIVALASKLTDIPAVLTWHNDLPPVTSVANFLIRMHDNLILPRYIHTYRRVISTSETYAKQSRVLPKLGRMVTIIPNGVDCQRFNPAVDGARLRAELGLDGKFTILFVGALSRWHGYKGLDVLLRAARIMVNREWVLLVVGEGDLKEQYRGMSRQLGVSPRTVFLGDVPDEELPACYAAADVLVLPSKDESEGFGLTALEANATGKAVVASNVGGIPSVVTHNYNGLLVAPNNPGALSEALLLLASNQELAARMGRNGRKVAEDHAWSRTASLTERVYLESIEAAG